MADNKFFAWRTIVRAMAGLCLLAMVTIPAQGQTTPATATTATEVTPQKLPLPAMSMPWRFVGIDQEEITFARQALTQSQTTLVKAWLTNPQPLTTYATPWRVVPLNAKQVTDQITTGQPSRQGPNDITLTVEPVWCSMMDQQLLFVTIADANRDTLLAAAHTIIPQKTWRDAARNRSLSGILQQHVQTLFEKAWQKLSSRDAAVDDSAMHVGLSLGYNASRRDEGDSQCMNLLVSEKLATTFNTIRPLGADHLATARFVLGLQPALARPSRVVLSRWFTSAKQASERRLPATFTLDATLVESIFGKRIPGPKQSYKSQWTFAATSDQTGNQIIDFKIDEDLDKLLRGEAEALKRDDLPQIAKVDRAWVYLDRGRAWGLKMSDRLVAEVNGEPVKGHVVRFFGPEAKLKSPRGFPINEGAILYIRKNQKLSKLGLSFRFDPTTYPAP